MCTDTMTAILQAQSLLMVEHEVTSETALGLLVWEADRRGVTVADVAVRVRDELSTSTPLTVSA